MSRARNIAKSAAFIAAAFFSSSALFAQTGGGGFVSASYEDYDFRIGTSHDEGGTMRIDGAYTIPLGSHLNLQLDAGLTRTTYQVKDNFEVASTSANLFYRNDHFSIGAFAGYAHLSVPGGRNDYQAGGGVEANAYLGPVSLGAIYAMLDTRTSFGTSFKGFDLTARVFPTENLAIRAKYSIVDVGFPVLDPDLRGTGLSVEYQPPHLPLAFQLGVTRQRISEFDYTYHSVFAGVRYVFGNQSLRYRDRHTTAAVFTDLFTPR